MSYLYRLFSAKEPYIYLPMCGLFANNDLQVQVTCWSSPRCKISKFEGDFPAKQIFKNRHESQAASSLHVLLYLYTSFSATVSTSG